MKTKIIHLFPLILLLSISATASAQTGLIEQMPIKILDSSIVRDWTESRCILYYKNYHTNKSYFCVEDISTHTILTAELPSFANIDITDFRVRKDSVFFCGTFNLSPSQHGALVGFFDINRVFFSSPTDQIHYGLFPFIDTANATVFELLRPQRMDVIPFRGVTHIVLVGTTYHATRADTSTTLCDVFFDNSTGTWTANQYVNGSPGIVFTDVASSGSFVAVAAKKNVSTEYFTGVYLPSANILNTPLYPGILYKMGGNKPLDDVLIESIGLERFVLAHYSKFPNDSYGTEFDMFDINTALSSVTPLFYWQVYHGNTTYFSMGWQLRRLCYHNLWQRMMLLHDISCPALTGVESTVFCLDMTLPTPSMGIKALHFPNLSLKEFDRMNAGLFHATGTLLPNGRIGALTHEWSLISTGCRSEFVPEFDVIPLLMTESPYLFDQYSPVVSPVSISPTLADFETSIVCERH